MSRKLSLAVVVAAGLALGSTVAPAANPPHYFVNGVGNGNRLAEQEGVSTVAWGSLTFTSISEADNELTCHVVTGGTVENPGEGASGAPGVGDTQSFNPYECESPQCSPAATGSGPGTYPSLLAEPDIQAGGNLTDLDWRSQLITEGTSIRSDIEGVRISVLCHIEVRPGEFVTTEEHSEGAIEPEYGPTRTRVSAPPEWLFSGESCLVGSEAAGNGEYAIEGELKTLGYAEQGIVNAKIGRVQPSEAPAASCLHFVQQPGSKGEFGTNGANNSGEQTFTFSDPTTGGNLVVKCKKATLAGKLSADPAKTFATTLTATPQFGPCEEERNGVAATVENEPKCGFLYELTKPIEKNLFEGTMELVNVQAKCELKIKVAAPPGGNACEIVLNSQNGAKQKVIYANINPNGGAQELELRHMVAGFSFTVTTVRSCSGLGTLAAANTGNYSGKVKLEQINAK